MTFAFVAGALIAGALASTAAYAEDTAWCPKAGTVVSVSEGGVARSWTALGPDPEDATVCRSVAGAHEGPVVDGGNVWRRLFNRIFLNESSIYTSDTIERMRDAWRAILSGQRDKSDFVDVHGSRGNPRVATSAIVTLTREGQEELLIGGRPVSTVRLKSTYRRTYSSLNAISYAYSWEVWYAPELRIFVKGQFTGVPGFTGNTSTPVLPPPDWEVTSVQGP